MGVVQVEHVVALEEVVVAQDAEEATRAIAIGSRKSQLTRRPSQEPFRTILCIFTLHFQPITLKANVTL